MLQLKHVIKNNATLRYPEKITRVWKMSLVCVIIKRPTRPCVTAEHIICSSLNFIDPGDFWAEVCIRPFSQGGLIRDTGELIQIFLHCLN